MGSSGTTPPGPPPTVTSSPLTPLAKKQIREAHNAFVRWQKTRSTQFGHVVNLVLTLTTASLGFAVNLLVEKKVALALSAGNTFLWALVAFILAAAVGLLTNLSRLYDFRYTALAARGHELELRGKAGEKFTDEDDQLKIRDRDKNRRLAKRWGTFSWRLLAIQLLAFLLGILLLACAARAGNLDRETSKTCCCAPGSH